MNVYATSNQLSSEGYEHLINEAGDVVVVCANGKINRTYASSIDDISELNNSTMVFDVSVSKKCDWYI